MTLLVISFIAGVLTVLAPCILPLLPVVIGGSTTDHTDRTKPYIITASLAVSVIVFTLLLKATTLVIDIPPAFWTWFSGTILVILGLVLLFPALWERFPGAARFNSASQRLLSRGERKGGALGDIMMGAALGPVFSTCSPTYFVILATVLPSSIILGLTYLLAYVAGLSLMLLAIAILGQRLVGRLIGSADPRGWFKRSMGVLILVVGVFVISGFDKKLETAVLDAGFFDVTRIEQFLLQSSESESMPKGTMKSDDLPALRGSGTGAPELTDIDGYVNTNDSEITIGQFRERGVVLVDFWTYSCINCKRTIPYLNEWYELYHDKGLEIIGVHTPEFAFEQQYDNVRQAVDEFGIEYPVVLDNDYATWRAFGNRYWPRKYLIDHTGHIVYDHIGEGGYRETQRAIEAALERLGTPVDELHVDTTVETVDADREPRSPETYFGARRNERLGNGVAGRAGAQDFVHGGSPAPDTLYLEGRWDIRPQYAETVGDATAIEYVFTARDVYMVLGAEGEVSARVYVDDVRIDTSAQGTDIHDGTLTVQEERMYHVYSNTQHGTHTLRIEPLTPGLQAYTFTFG